jgi:YVTN family beta-propeller protein
MTDRDDRLFPNAGDDTTRTVGLSRRHLLSGSAAAGAVGAAGCLGGDGADSTTTETPAPGTTGEPTVFVFNTGDRTVSLIDPREPAVLGSRELGVTASFPSNQFTPSLTTAREDPLWLNVGQGVRAFAAGSLAEQATVETGSGANWLEQTPDGENLVVSAREPAHRQFRIDADPASETFGEVTAEIDRTPEGGRGNNDGPGPCDVTIHPDGAYAYVPDLYGDTLTVLDVEAFEVETQITVDPVGDGPAAPWMGTAAWDGETLLVEHNEGAEGTESVWDVSDPAAPRERARLTAEDGLGSGPLTSEIGPDSSVGYVFTPGTEDVTLIDLEAGSVLDRLDLGGQAFVGTWGPDRQRLFVPVQTANEVAVVDHEQRAITHRLSVGPKPYGATAGTVRPPLEGGTEERLARLRAATDETGTTYCIGNCACGHEL